MTDTYPYPLTIITINRLYPVVNGFVQIPNNLEQNRSTISIAEALNVDGVQLVCMGPTGVARVAGGKPGIQEMIQLPDGMTVDEFLAAI